MHAALGEAADAALAAGAGADGHVEALGAAAEGDGRSLASHEGKVFLDDLPGGGQQLTHMVSYEKIMMPVPEVSAGGNGS